MSKEAYYRGERDLLWSKKGLQLPRSTWYMTHTHTHTHVHTHTHTQTQPTITSVNLVYDSQSSWSKGSSMVTTGNSAVKRLYTSASSCGLGLGFKEHTSASSCSLGLVSVKCCWVSEAKPCNLILGLVFCMRRL